MHFGGRETGRIGTEFGQPLDRQLARLAERQHGVVALGQLVHLGLSANAVRKRVRSGRLHRVHRGVYAVGRARLELRGLRLAAVLACGPGAVLSHRTAADALGILPRRSAVIEVTIPGRSGRSRPGITIHRSRTLRPRDRTTIDAIPCTACARTLTDLAALVDRRALATAIENAERLRIFDLRKLDVSSRALRNALALYREPPPTREAFERLAFEVFAAAGLDRPAVNVLVDTPAEQLEVDFCWPDRRLVVEADSWEYHRTRAAFERDRRRDWLLHAAGWICLRITWRQLKHAPGEVIAALRAGSGTRSLASSG